MILVAVIIGYLLGILPFIILRIIEKIDYYRNLKHTTEEQKDMVKIFDEYFNGATAEDEKPNQQNIYNEYMSGEEKEGE